MLEIPVLLSLFLIAYFWYNQMQALDTARSVGKRITQQNQCFFLDDSVVQKKISIKSKAGKLCFYREFEFEFSDVTASRNKGTIIHHGQQVTEIQFFINNAIESIKL